MSELSQHQKIWRLREGGKHDEDFGLALAILIYLRWADFQEAEQEAIAAFDDSDYEPSIPDTLHWRSWCYLQSKELHSFLTEKLPSSLSGLHNNRNGQLATHLYRVGQSLEIFWRFKAEEVASMVGWLSEQPFETPSDRVALLEIFDNLLSATTHRWSGEYQTPASIADLIAKIAMPADGERIYDPCFGSARLLTAAYQHVLQSEKDRRNRRGVLSLNIFGVELSSQAYIIGLTRLILAGIDTPKLELGNSLERMHSDNPQRDGFDLVLANPPWGMRVPTELMKHYPLPMRDATGMFIQHALAQLRPGGRTVIIVPQGILFRSGAEQRLRDMLLKQHTVEAIVSLPETVFLPFTAVRSSIIKIRRGGTTKRIRMVDAEHLFEKGKGRQPATIQPDFSEKITQYLHTSKPSQYCWDVEADDLAKVDLDFTPRRRDQSGLIGILESLRSEIEVLALKDCCQIQIGKSLRREKLLDTPPNRLKSPKQTTIFPKQNKGIEQKTLFDTPNIPYVRIKDINRGIANKGSSWLSPDAATTIQPKWKMKAGDVLLSKSGTIGKVGLVSNGAVGGIAANGLFVLKPDQNRLDPHYLIAFMNSAECRLWLDDHSHAGTTIRHLSKAVLEKMPVPLPAIQIQHRVAKQHREYKIDVLDYLSQLLTETEKDPITEWINKIVSTLPADPDAIEDPLDLSILERLAIDVQALRNKSVHESQGERRLVSWIMSFNHAMSSLRGIGDVPPGPGLLTLLQESAHNLTNASQKIHGHLPDEVKAQNLAKLIKSRLDMACSKLLSEVNLTIDTDHKSLEAGGMVEISLQVANRGPLPLRDFQITTSPDWGKSKIPYLSEHQKTKVQLSGTAPKIAGVFTLIVSWRGTALDGHPVDGSREFALNFHEPKEQGKDFRKELGGSPYVCGDPVRPDRKDVFFGREELLGQIRRQITQSGNVVLLEGNRRAGKSSILWHLEGPEAVTGWMGIYCSLQGAEGSRDGVGVPTAEIFREMAKSIATRLHTLGGETPLPDETILPPDRKLGIARACRQGITEDSPFTDFREYAEVALERLDKENLGLLIMLDEFDKLQEGIDSGVTSPQVPENIRFLVQTYPRFCAILTGSRRLKRLREEYWSALFGLGTRFGVTSLPEDAARLLVTKPVEDKLTYSQEAIERAIILTAKQPYLLQCLCNRIFDLAVQLKTDSVNLDMVNQAGNTLVEDNEHFASLWDYAKSDRRRFILALCHRERESPDALTLGIMQEKLLGHGVEVDDETLIIDLEFLRELELIDKEDDSSGTSYSLTIPLMGSWIAKQQDFAALRIKARLETEDQNG